MGGIVDFFTGTLGSIIAPIGNIIDNLHTSDEEKAAAKLAMQALIQKRDSEIEQTIRAELGAKERVLVAELQQGDAYTKRARPTVVYAGLLMIAWNYCIAPVFDLNYIDLPTQFWAAWGGIVATWSIGRSAEKRGTRNKITSIITGS